MTTATITVWLPDLGWVQTMGGLPGPMTADVWTGGEELPVSAGQVEIVVIPFGLPDPGSPCWVSCPRCGWSSSCRPVPNG